MPKIGQDTPAETALPYYYQTETMYLIHYERILFISVESDCRFGGIYSNSAYLGIFIAASLQISISLSVSNRSEIRRRF